MDKPAPPTKEVVRMYMQSRFASKEPPPSPEEINRHLGKSMIEQQRTGKYRR